MSIERRLKRVLPAIKARIEALPSDFPIDVRHSLIEAERKFAAQGGCASVMNVYTTEDGMFLSPVGKDVQSGPEIRLHMFALLDTKPGATAVEFSFKSTPDGGGSLDGRSTLNCLYMTRQCLHVMQADITGHRSLGDWSITTVMKGI